MSSVLHILVYLTVSPPQLNILHETLITLTLWGERKHAKVWSGNKLLTHDNSDINFSHPQVERYRAVFGLH